MDNLRLILILIGVVILVGIVLFHNHGKARRRDHASRREPRVEPGLAGDKLPPGGRGGDSREDPESQPAQENLRLDPEDPPAPAPSRREPKISEPAPSRPEPREESDQDQPREAPDPAEKIIILYLKGRKERKISGVELLDSALKAGLVFGEMNIFHRRQEGGDRSVFSMADITNPGSFDPTSWNLFETPGVTLFLTLPGPISALDAWDAMLATGQRLSELLEADLLDDSQSTVTRQRIAQIREEMRDYDRKQGLTAQHGP